MSFLCGLLIGLFILEPLIINYIYFSNVSLFNDIILFEKNRKKLEEYYLSKNRN